MDGSNPIIASQIIGMVSRGLGHGRRRPAARRCAALPPAFEVRSRAWYNDSLKSQVSMVPGLMAIVLSLPALALSLSLTREKELGTLEGLMATPIEGMAYLAGKMSAYVVTGLAGLLVCWLVAVAWFQVPFRGEMGAAGRADRGLLPGHHGHQPADLQPHLQPADGHAAGDADLLRAQLLPGRPDRPHRPHVAVAVCSRAPLPATHYIAITRGLFLKGVGMETLLQPSLMLLLMGLLALLISTLLFKKKLANAAPSPITLTNTNSHSPISTHSPSQFTIHHSPFIIPMFSRTWQIIVKELLHFRRDRVLTIFLFVFPLVQLVLVAQTAGSDPANLPLAVWDQDTARSAGRSCRRWTTPGTGAALPARPACTRSSVCWTPARLRWPSSSRLASPPTWSSAGAPAAVQVIVDGSNVSGGSSALAAAEGAISSALSAAPGRRQPSAASAALRLRRSSCRPWCASTRS